MGSGSSGLSLPGADTISTGMVALRAKATMAFPTSQMKRWAARGRYHRDRAQSMFGNTVSTVAASRSRATRMGMLSKKRPG